MKKRDKKQIALNATSIDDFCWNLGYIAETLDYSLETPSRRYREAASDIVWYINTGRCSTPQLKMLVNLSRTRIKNMLKKAVKADYTRDAHIKACIDYLYGANAMHM